MNLDEASLDDINKGMYEELQEKRKKHLEEHRDEIQGIMSKYEGKEKTNRHLRAANGICKAKLCVRMRMDSV